MSKPQEKTETSTALKPYDEVVGVTMKRIGTLQSAGQLLFPQDYSPQNALQSAWLILQNTMASVKEDSRWKKVSVLTHCTKASIANALLDMVIQGLNPVKKQGSFIAYGKQLSFQPEYFGNMLLAKRADERIADDGIQAEVILEGDEIDYEIQSGKRFITKHKQTFENLSKGKITGAYCSIITKDGEILNTTIMTLDEIHQAWKKSRAKPFDDKGNLKPDSTHAEYPVEMCKKTVINRACKTIINSSSDKNLLKSVKRQEIVQAEEEGQAEIDENANQEFVDIPIEEEATTSEDSAEQEEPESEEGEVQQEKEATTDILVECPGITGVPIGTVKDVEWCRTKCKGFKKCRVAQDAIANAVKASRSSGGQMTMGPAF